MLKLTRNKIMLVAIKALVLTFVFSSVTSAAMPKSPKLAASAYILLDFNSGKVIAEKNSTKKIEPASLTKMMSSYVID